MGILKLSLLFLGTVSIVGSVRESEEYGGETGDLDASGSGRIMAVLPEDSSSFGILDASKSGGGLLNGPPFSASFQGGAKGQYYMEQPTSFHDGGGMRSGKQLGSNALSALSSLSPQALLALSASGNSYGQLTEPLSSLASELGEHGAASGSYGGGHYSLLHSGLGKFGFGKDPNYETAVNYSAVGLLGFLALLALIENVLRQMTSTTLKPSFGRKKRSSEMNVTDDWDQDEMNVERDAREIIGWTLPLLTAAAHVKDGLIPLECAFLDICSVNNKLVKEMGQKGRSLGFSMTKAVHKLLEGDKDFKSGNLKIIEAGKLGRKVKDAGSCIKRFPRCRQLELLPQYTIPASMIEARSQ